MWGNRFISFLLFCYLISRNVFLSCNYLFFFSQSEFINTNILSFTTLHAGDLKETHTQNAQKKFDVNSKNLIYILVYTRHRHDRNSIHLSLCNLF